MEIEVNLDKLREVKLFIATPMYGGMSHGLYVKSCLELQGMMNKYGVETKFSFLFNESLITRARNYLVDEFLRSDFTHMMFIDSDIHYKPQDVVAMLALDRDIIGGPYPKKAINWKNIIHAVKNIPNIEPKDLESIVGDYVFNPVRGTKSFDVSEPLEVMEIGTGYMLIKREVFDKMRDAYPMIHYRPDHAGQVNFDGSRYIHAYFDTVIDSKESITAGGTDRYLSEDYMFCQMWRKIGGQIYLCPWVYSQHIGTYAFTGNMPAVANFTGRL